jgi:NitT/TauT family transport system substrate-binding protein
VVTTDWGTWRGRIPTPPCWSKRYALGRDFDFRNRDANGPIFEFRVAWSIYVGWMPWGYLELSGIMDKWADKYGIDVEIVQINDYVESINQYTAGAFDGVSATNMDTLSIPAGGGVDTTALIVGDYSNGNDAVILKGEGDAGRPRRQAVNLVELSVSHYLLARALDSVGLAERDLAGVINTSDADMIAALPPTTSRRW